MSDLGNVTLQINLCAGDILYAEQTVPKIIENHKGISTILLLVDTYKPQKTKVLNPEERFPEPEYSTKVKKIKAIAENLKQANSNIEIYYFENDNELIQQIAKKYLHKCFIETHDTTGMAIMPYWAGIEKVKTKYVLHYDADILPYREENYEWIEEALEYLSDDEKFISAIPRNAPPCDKTGNVPTFHQGRPIEEFENYWTNDWFGTRCFLMDKEKLDKYLPLFKGKLLFEAFARKITQKSFPISPETAMNKRIGALGGRKIILKNKKAWYLHPVDKKEQFVELLPEIYDLFKNDEIPEAQRGWEDMKLEEWIAAQ